MKKIIIVPAYNEERSIGTLIEQVVKNHLVSLCVVVDDASTDRTADIAQKSGATVLRRSKRSGTGSAIKFGLQYAVENKADIVILMDADGQHDPKYINTLIKEIHSTKELVIGSRYIQPTTTSTSLFRQIGTKIISFLIKTC
jgi:glycosyltransferase involved in cell wall biosynthesis